MKKMAEGFSGQRLVIVPSDRVEAALKLPVLRDLLVTHFGHFTVAENHFIQRPHGTAEHILIYCLAGRGQCGTPDGTWQVGPGDALFLPPHVFHTYQAEPSDPWTIFWFHFKGDRAADYVETLHLEGSCPILHAPQTNALRQAFEDAYRQSLNEFTDSSLLVLSTGLARVIGLLSVYSRPRGSRSEQSENKIQETISGILGNPTREWPLDELAAGAGMSLRNFCEAFHKQVGCPPRQFVIRQRLQMACALMAGSELTISEIADRVGYQDLYYFSRLFRKKTGMSPRAYRTYLAKADGRS